MARRRLPNQGDAGRQGAAAGQARLVFLFPLQLATDYQIRAHSPFADARDAVRHVIASFARGGSDRKLVLVVHPLDNGLLGWRGVAMKFARQYGIADKVEVLDGGIPGDVLRESAGVVTINSTVGRDRVAAGRAGRGTRQRSVRRTWPDLSGRSGSGSGTSRRRPTGN
jgi:capsular polysaccharide export protein